MAAVIHQLRLSLEGCNTGLEGSDESPPLSDTGSLRTKLLDLALGVADLIQNFQRSSIDVSKINVICCPAMYLAMDILIEADDSWSAGAGNCRHDYQITEIYIVLRAIARRSPSAAATFRTAQLDYRYRGVEMPATTLKLSGEFETSDVKLWDGEVPRTSLSSHLDLEMSGAGQERPEYVSWV